MKNVKGSEGCEITLVHFEGSLNTKVFYSRVFVSTNSFLEINSVQHPFNVFKRRFSEYLESIFKLFFISLVS